MRRHLLLLVLLGLALPACVQQRCFENLDCPAPQVCGASGACVFECSESQSCGAGFTCVDHVCKAVPPPAAITCPEDMVAVAGAYCIDRYEASRPDATASSAGGDRSSARSVPFVLPWFVGSNEEAALGCQAAGKRLCAPEEWQLACEGSNGTAYSYGDAYAAETCNGIDTYGRSAFHLMPTGSFPGCTNEWGAFDMNGNVWEHVAGGTDRTVRGGAYNCYDSETYHRCDYVPRSWTPSALGFRCCLTAVTPADAGWPDGAGAGTETGSSDAAAAEIGCIDDAGGGERDTSATEDSAADVPIEGSVSEIDATTFSDSPAAEDVGAIDVMADGQSALDAGAIDVAVDVAPAACPPSMAEVAGVCMDIYEASRSDATASVAGVSSIASTRPGVLPWFPVTLVEARTGCASMGKRLCRPEEWFAACSGDGNATYVYGPAYQPATCNGIDTFCDCSGACASLAVCPYPHCYNQPADGKDQACGASFHVMPTGSFPGCTASHGLMDVNGNVWEVVDSDDGLEHFRGGAYNCGDSELLHRCDYDATWGPSAKGFRCCADRGAP